MIMFYNILSDKIKKKTNTLLFLIFLDHEDMDEYVPPPAVVMNGRESRGKSPVTPSYRKPPPYVSP